MDEERKTVAECLSHIEELKKLYKKERYLLEFEDNDFDQSFVLAKMDRYKKEIRSLKEEIASLELENSEDRA
jgi:hypothetical protein